MVRFYGLSLLRNKNGRCYHFHSSGDGLTFMCWLYVGEGCQKTEFRIPVVFQDCSVHLRGGTNHISRRNIYHHLDVHLLTISRSPVPAHHAFLFHSSFSVHTQLLQLADLIWLICFHLLCLPCNLHSNYHKLSDLYTSHHCRLPILFSEPLHKLPGFGFIFQTDLIMFVPIFSKFVYLV